jgi:hypothetical protein
MDATTCEDGGIGDADDLGDDDDDDDWLGSSIGEDGFASAADDDNDDVVKSFFIRTIRLVDVDGSNPQ